MNYKDIIAQAYPLKHNAQVLLDILMKTPNVKVFSESIAESLGIAPKNSDRYIRAICQYLGERGICILGDKDGIWFSDRPEDIRAYIARRKAEADAAYATTMERLNAMHRTAQILEVGSVSEQISIFG